MIISTQKNQDQDFYQNYMYNSEINKKKSYVIKKVRKENKNQGQKVLVLGRKKRHSKKSTKIIFFSTFRIMG